MSTGTKGFTLIEMLVVMGIIAILAGTLIMGLPAMLRAGDVTAMETYITTLATQLEAYEKRMKNGDYPPTSLADGFPGVGPHYTRDNCGIESVVVCINRRGESGAYTFEGSKIVTLENFDSDRSMSKLTNFEVKELFEVVDTWETPLAYFHNRDYSAVTSKALGRIMVGDGSVIQVKPWKNPKTKQYYNSRSFQIISAGPDGEFNTRDDITNFRKE